MGVFQKMLFATRFNELTFDALESLLDLCRAGLNHIVLLNVIERDRVAMFRGTGYQKSEEVKLKEVANINFIQWAETLFERGLEVGVYIVVGTLVQQVAKAARNENADLIVVGRPTRSRLDQLLQGSDLFALIRRTHVPVLVYKDARPDNLERERPFWRPLLATDWSPAAEYAVECLAELKDVVEEIHVVHVGREEELESLSAMAVQGFRKASRERLAAVCEKLASHGIKAHPHLYVGSRYEEVHKAAREWRSSMVVIGASSKGAWHERMIGSFPRRLTEKSDLPTLIVSRPLARR